MSETDELRRMLDERGVECTTDDGEYLKETCWAYMGELMAYFVEFDNGTTRFELDHWYFTPEQAIAATLGGGECELVYGENDHGDDGWWCQSCGGWFAASFRHTGRNNIIEPSYCQQCGKAVKR